MAGLVCSNIAAGNNRHYWLVECSQGKPQTVYDSLKGVQKITRELYRSLSVTGLLLTGGTGKKPVLRTADLDVVAGRVPRVERQAKPIQVAGRSASYRQRNFLMPKLKNLGSPGRNLKSFFHDRSDLLGDHPSGSTSQKNRVSSRPPRVKADATKRDQRTRSNRPKAARTSGLMQQSERSGSKKKEVASSGSKGTAAKVNPTIVDKDCHPKDLSGQPNPAAIEFENELPRDKLDAPAPHKGENDDKQHCAIDLEKEVQSNAPPSDPICCFTSDDEEMLHAPTRKAKRPFEEVNLDLKAGEHGSPEDQKRRNSGPPQPQNLHTVHTRQEKEKEPSFDAARFRASVETDPANDLDLQKEVCQTTKANESEVACWTTDWIWPKRDQWAGTNKWWLRSHNTIWWSFLSSADAHQEIWVCSCSSDPCWKWHWCSSRCMCWVWLQGRWTVEFYPARDCCPFMSRMFTR